MTNSYVNKSMLDMTNDLLGMLRVRPTNSEGVGNPPERSEICVFQEPATSVSNVCCKDGTPDTWAAVFAGCPDTLLHECNLTLAKSTGASRALRFSGKEQLLLWLQQFFDEVLCIACALPSHIQSWQDGTRSNAHTDVCQYPRTELVSNDPKKICDPESPEPAHSGSQAPFFGTENGTKKRSSST